MDHELLQYKAEMESGLSFLPNPLIKSVIMVLPTFLSCAGVNVLQSEMEGV